MSDAAAPDWRRNQAAVTGATFIGFAGFTLVMPFLPLYFEQLGVQSARSVAIWSGLSLGVTPAVTAAMAPVWARLAERYGRKMMVGRSLISFMVIMGALAVVRAPWQVFFLRAIQGFFAGYGPIALTMAAESAPPDKIATAIGWVHTAQRLGPALGPVIGGAVTDLIGWRGTFVLIGAVFMVVAAVLTVRTRAQWGEEKGAKFQGNPFATHLRLLGIPRVRTVLSVGLIETFFFFGAFSFLGAYFISRFGVSLTLAGVLLAGFGIGGLLYTLMV